MLVSLPFAVTPGARGGKRISPDEGVSSPAMICSSVDLPHPDGPSRIRNSPGATSRVMDSSALTRSPVRWMSQTLPTSRSATSTCDIYSRKVRSTTRSIGTLSLTQPIW